MRGEQLYPSLLSPHPSPQNEPQVARARNRIVVVRLTSRKPKRRIKPLRRRHLRQRIQQHFPITRRPRERDRAFRQLPAKALSAPRGPHVQTLHFTAAGLQGTDADAAQCLFPVRRQQQRAAWRRVGAWERRKFFLKALEAEVDAEPGLVLAEEMAGGGDAEGECGSVVDQCQSGFP